MNRAVDFPLKIVVIFLLAVLALYFLSPFQWPTNNPLWLALYNISIILSLYIGYKFGLRSSRVRFQKETKFYQPLSSLIFKNLNKLLFLNVLFIYPKFVMKIGKGYLTLPEIFDSIALGFISPELAYSNKFLDRAEEFLSLSHPLVFSYFIFSPLIFATIPIMIYLWKKLNRVQKIITVLLIIVDILIYISIGTNKGIFDYVIMIPFVLYAKSHSIGNDSRKLKPRSKIILILVISFLAIGYFTKGNIRRTKSNFGYDAFLGKSINKDALILKVLPDFLDKSYISLDYYLTQGYFALDKALGMKFIPTYGVGHSMLLSSLTEKVIGKNEVNRRTYQFRLDKDLGYSQYQRWHSFYVSVANDISFIGVVLFVFLLGYWFSQVWTAILFRNNLLAVAVMPLFMIMFFYFSANNQVLGNIDQSFMFWVLLIAFFYDKRNTKILNKQLA